MYTCVHSGVHIHSLTIITNQKEGRTEKFSGFNGLERGDAGSTHLTIQD